MYNLSLRATSVGVNQVTECVDWGQRGHLAYGAHNQAIIYNIQDAAVVATLRGHSGRVNCVRWLSTKGDSESLLLATGSADSTVIVWRVQLSNVEEPWKIVARLEGHEGSVTTLATQQLPDSSTLLVSSASEGRVCVWQCNADDSCTAEAEGWHIRQTVAFGTQLQLCADVVSIPGFPEWLLMACGGVDGAVRLLVCSPDAEEFVEVTKVTGHQDWVRSVAFCFADAAGDTPERLLLASGSQDTNIRIWAVLREELASAHAAASPVADPDQPALPSFISRFAPKPRMQIADTAFTITLESVLVGHDDWVGSVAWHPQLTDTSRVKEGLGGVQGGRRRRQRPCLLSASMDRTMMLWRPDEASGLWMSEESVGDAGASHLGYFSGRFSPDGTAIVANGYTGALHMWARDVPQERGTEAAGDSCQSTSGPDEGRWIPQHASGGHHGAVTDVTWAFDDAVLLSVSRDQTARAFGSPLSGGWCEIARPQMHGHDFSSLAFLPSRDAYAATAEEKVVRVLEAPRVFFDTVAALCGRQLQPSQTGQSSKALGASVTALGLSQKAVQGGSEDVQDTSGGAFYSHGPDLAPDAKPSVCHAPPLEEQLVQNTLWPEIRKLFGHGNNVQAVACTGSLLASAAESKTADLADIWLWDTESWACLGRLAAHSLSVTQLQFSPDGQNLLSTSRDRSFAVFSAPQDASPGSSPFTLSGHVVKAHVRMILAGSWAPDSNMFATGGRDNCFKLWGMTARGPSHDACATVKLQAAVTAVQFRPFVQHRQGVEGNSRVYLVAVGLDDGALQLWTVSLSADSVDASMTRGPNTNTAQGPNASTAQGANAAQTDWSKTAPSCVCTWQATQFEAHAGAVRKICWRRLSDPASWQLASCSDDHSIKLFDFTH